MCKSKNIEIEAKPEEIVSMLTRIDRSCWKLRKQGNEGIVPNASIQYKETVQRHRFVSDYSSQKLDLAPCYQNQTAVYEKLVRSHLFNFIAF